MQWTHEALERPSGKRQVLHNAPETRQKYAAATRGTEKRYQVD